MSLLLIGCNDYPDKDKDHAYNFVGDSLIARWSLSESFPSLLTYNFGKSGSGISYIRELEGRFVGTDVVVLTGTNDENNFYPDKIDNYINDYLGAINKLSDNNIYLISVLPRKFEGDPEDVNDRIANFNQRVKDALSAYPNIVYIDVFDNFMDGDHINYQYYSDGLHLSVYGYEFLSSRLLNKIY
ncbi:MAG: SGNH/GDSL hydrolase family protein [Muribaculaceae bacterium]